MRGNIWKLYVLSFLGGVAFFYNSIETLYYRHFGLSFQQIGSLLSASLLAKVILDVPTGAFADTYGKKKSLLISTACTFLGVSCLLFGSSFGVFFLGFLLWGTGGAFTSGASSALLYESLQTSGRETTFLTHAGRLQALFISVDIVSGALGPFLYSFNARLPYFISWGALFAIFPLQLLLVERSLPHSAVSNIFKQHMVQIIEGLRLIRRDKVFLWLTLFSLLLAVLSGVWLQMISLPFFLQIGYTLKDISIIAVLWNIMQTTSTFFVDRIEHQLGKNRSFLIIVLFLPLIFFLLAICRNLFGSALLAGFYLSLVSFGEMIIQSHLNHHIQVANRATILSISSMFVSVFTLITLPLFGLFVDATSTMLTLYVLGGIALLVGGCLLLWRSKNMSMS
jgi:MFS family permease